jgi:DNA polymerase-3 subunit epsilon
MYFPGITAVCPGYPNASTRQHRAHKTMRPDSKRSSTAYRRPLMKKVAYIDVETTGVNFYSCGVVQIAMIIEIGGQLKEALNLRCRPFPNDVIMPSALEVLGKTEEELQAEQDPVNAHRALLDIMDKYVDRYDREDKFWFIGYNSYFDDQFLRKWFRQCGDPYYGSWFFWPALDVAQIAAQYLYLDRPTMPNFKLGTVAKQLGIQVKEEDLHDAMIDVQVTRDIYYKTRR